MKKCILSFLIISLFSLNSLSLQAQDSPVSLGAKAGLNLTGFSGDMNDTKMIINYHLGITADIELADGLYILTELDLINKGAKYKPKNGEHVKFKPIYVQFPIHIGHKMNLDEVTRLVFSVGPYFAYGIGGKIKANEKTDFFGDETFKRFDMGFGAKIGMEVNNIAVNVGYDFGLLNINQDKNMKVRNQNIYLTLGYKLNLE
ncbi:MAG: PorT family protein [Candidatus Azobacteroides sp.]|nr:PorT family protein [Candidatus Azobacteroides sp.]